MNQFRLSLGCAGHHRFSLGANCFNSSQNLCFWQIYWIWPDFGGTVVLWWKGSWAICSKLSVYWAKHHLRSHSSARPASRLFVTLGGCLSVDLWNAVLSSGSQTPQWEGGGGGGGLPNCFPKISWDFTLCFCEWTGSTRPQAKHICHFPAANHCLWDVLMSCFIGISTCYAPSYQIYT